MHQWDDTGIVLTAKAYGEQSAIVRVFTAQHGIVPGMVKGAFARKNRATYQPGNVVHVHWQARLEEHLGQFRCEMERSFATEILTSPLALKVVNSIGAVVNGCVPERIVEIDIYNHLIDLLSNLEVMDADALGFFSHYVRTEMAILQALGFGLDLTACAATGEQEEAALVYVSPKSGRAVSGEAGAPYHDKMLPLPAFLKRRHARESAANMQQVLDGMRLTGYFLESRLLAPEGKPLPEARNALLAAIQIMINP